MTDGQIICQGRNIHLGSTFDPLICKLPLINISTWYKYKGSSNDPCKSTTLPGANFMAFLVPGVYVEPIPLCTRTTVAAPCSFVVAYISGFHTGTSSKWLQKEQWAAYVVDFGDGGGEELEVGVCPSSTLSKDTHRPATTKLVVRRHTF